MTTQSERYIPAGSCSLVDDAPGWSDNDAIRGPTCWKCHGKGGLGENKQKKKGSLTTACPVCGGNGNIAPKKKELAALQHHGEITRRRRSPPGWKPEGLQPYAAQQQQQQQLNTLQTLTRSEQEALKLLHLAEIAQQDVPVNLSAFHTSEKELIPLWLPRQGEQLCNLVGQWRILQRVASHRWTTDDLVTAYVAGRFVGGRDGHHHRPIKKYLDLGCGNGSVLLMTTWQLLLYNQDHYAKKIATTGEMTKIICTGIEARQEAVQLARRSIAFNLGDRDHPCVDIQVHHGDFRSILTTLVPTSSDKYDLITGTPPYFKVDFTLSHMGMDNEDKINNVRVEKAVINQGGMPTCKQSAPARCEFRGGIEAYCQAAALAMHAMSIFCVCENWINDKRVYQAAKTAGLVVVQVQPVEGKVGKPGPLFAVYVMQLQGINRQEPFPTKVLQTLAVRDVSGNWTPRYQQVLQAMSIPIM